MVTEELHKRIDRLEQSDKTIVERLSTLNNRLDTALLTLTHNVNSLTGAIRDLQEAQAKTIELQHSIVILQERSSVIPDLQREVTKLMMNGQKNDVVLRGIRLMAGSAALAVLGIAIKAIFG